MHNESDKERAVVFAKALRADRISRGLTQKQLAAAVGFSQQNVTNLESSKSLPRPDLYVRLMAYFGPGSALANASPERLLAASTTKYGSACITAGGDAKPNMKEVLNIFVDAVVRTDELGRDQARMYMARIMADPANAGDLVRRLAVTLDANLDASSSFFSD